MKTINAEELDKLFDDGEDISEYDVPGSLRHIHERTKRVRVNVDFPAWVVGALDQESARLGITRQALIKFWVVDACDKLGKLQGDAASRT